MSEDDELFTLKPRRTLSDSMSQSLYYKGQIDIVNDLIEVIKLTAFPRNVTKKLVREWLENVKEQLKELE